MKVKAPLKNTLDLPGRGSSLFLKSPSRNSVSQPGGWNAPSICNEKHLSVSREHRRLSRRGDEGVQEVVVQDKSWAFFVYEWKGVGRFQVGIFWSVLILPFPMGIKGGLSPPRVNL